MKNSTLSKEEKEGRFALSVENFDFLIYKFIVPSEEAFEAVKLTNRDMALLVSSGVNNIVP